MTADELIVAVASNTTGPARPEMLDPTMLAQTLRFALELFLDEINYEADLRSSGALGARLLAGLAYRAEELGGGVAGNA